MRVKTSAKISMYRFKIMRKEGILQMPTFAPLRASPGPTLELMR